MEQIQSENTEVLQERYELVLERLGGITAESLGHPALDDYFSRMADFLRKVSGYYQFVTEGHMEQADEAQLQEWNRCLYEDILPEHYEESWGNPAYAAAKAGERWGQLLSAVYTELRGGIVSAAEKDLEDLLIRMELFVEIYSAFAGQCQEDGQLPAYDTICGIVYWYCSDYSDILAEKAVQRMVCPQGNPAAEIIRSADLTDVRYLYRYGEYVTENELETARFLAGLPQETIDTMADTYTEGYRIGF